MRKLVAAAICLLSLSPSVTTGRKCIKEARTRTGEKCCEQQLRRVDKALSRAGDIPEGSWICLSHRNLILAEDKRCSIFLQFLAHAQTFDRGVDSFPPNRFPLQPRSQAPSSLPPLVVRRKTLVAAGHVTTQKLGGKKICWAGGVTECFDCRCCNLCGFQNLEQSLKTTRCIGV